MKKTFVLTGILSIYFLVNPSSTFREIGIHFSHSL